MLFTFSFLADSSGNSGSYSDDTTCMESVESQLASRYLVCAVTISNKGISTVSSVQKCVSIFSLRANSESWYYSCVSFS